MGIAYVAYSRAATTAKAPKPPSALTTSKRLLEAAPVNGSMEAVELGLELVALPVGAAMPPVPTAVAAPPVGWARVEIGNGLEEL